MTGHVAYLFKSSLQLAALTAAKEVRITLLQATKQTIDSLVASVVVQTFEGHP